MVGHRLQKEVKNISTPRVIPKHLQARAFSHTDNKDAVPASDWAVPFLPIQPKLTIGQPDDKYEREADSVSAKVVKLINHPQFAEESENTQQAVAESKSKLGIQRESSVLVGSTDDGFERTLNQIRGSGNPLPPQIQTKMGTAMDADFSDVRVHTDATAAHLNQSVQAKAFTTGKDIFFNQGEYNPVSYSGQSLIAHELTHVVQQGGAGQSNGVVQRLITSSELADPSKAGPAKADRKIGFGRLSYTKKMSRRYKKVLSALDRYHQYNPGAISSRQKERKTQAKMLTLLLLEVKKSVQEYTDNHLDDAESARWQHINRVSTDASEEIQSVNAILQSPAYQDVEWKDALRVRELDRSGAFDDSLFHGSGSSLLDKIADSGQIMSGAALKKNGLIRDTGEGDFFSRASEEAQDEMIGEKNFISVGQGAPGLGTAWQYAEAAASDKNYNAARYTDMELANELGKLRTIIDNWQDDLNKIKNDDIMGARRNLGQFENLFNRLEQERTLRESLPKDHARRNGESYRESSYGLLLEFSKDGLDIENPRPALTLRMDTDSPRQLGGERNVNNESVDLRDPARLLRVYCPLEKVASVKLKVAQIVQHNEFEVIPFEALAGMSDAVKWTKEATEEHLETVYEKMRVMVLEAYSKGMSAKTPIDNKALVKASRDMNL